MRKRMHTAIVLAAVLLVPLLASAYPVYWVEEPDQICGAHPTTKEGNHGAPVSDRTTKFAIASKGAAAKEACPGGSYSVQVTFAEPRLALISTSVGTFTAAEATCPGRVYLTKAQRAPTFTTEWKVPCTAKGPSALIKVTSATGADAAFQAAAATVPLNAACAAAACATAAAAPAAAVPAAAAAAAKAAVPAVPAAATAKPAAAAAPPAVSPKPAAVAAPVVAAPKPVSAPAAAAAAAAPAAKAAAIVSTTKAVAVPGCTPSSLGYSCVATTRKNTKIHYSYGASPPENACTMGAVSGAVVAKAGEQLVHFAYEGEEAGYAALGFTANAGSMYPSDSVIGWVAPDGSAKVTSYHLTSYDVTPGDAVTGWAGNMGVVKTGGKTVVCFSRAMDAAAAKAVPKLNAAGSPLIWASSPESSLTQHNLWGSFTANLNPLLAAAAGGGATATTAAALAAAAAPAAVAEPDEDAIVAKNERVRIAHGAMMLIAFALLMPAGVLLARHKWLFGDESAGKIKPAWFKLHIYVQSLAVLTAVAGTILIFVQFGKGREKVAKLYTPHLGLGLAATIAGVVQGAIGNRRPPISHDQRVGWRVLHYAWGWLTMLGGIANCGIGMALIHGIQGDALAPWVAPTVAVLGLLLLAGFYLERRRSQLIADGLYAPHDHSFHPSAAVSRLNLMDGGGAPEKYSAQQA